MMSFHCPPLQLLSFLPLTDTGPWLVTSTRLWHATQPFSQLSPMNCQAHSSWRQRSFNYAVYVWHSLDSRGKIAVRCVARWLPDEDYCGQMRLMTHRTQMCKLRTVEVLFQDWMKGTVIHPLNYFSPLLSLASSFPHNITNIPKMLYTPMVNVHLHKLSLVYLNAIHFSAVHVLHSAQISLSYYY